MAKRKAKSKPAKKKHDFPKKMYVLNNSTIIGKPDFEFINRADFKNFSPEEVKTMAVYELVGHVDLIVSVVEKQF